MAPNLELEVNERIEIAPRKKSQDEECGGSKGGSNGIRRRCERIFVVAGFQQQVYNEQRDREKAEHEER